MKMRKAFDPARACRADLAAILQVSPSTLTGWVAAGLPHALEAGRQTFNVPAVLRWLEAKRRRGGSLQAELARLAKEQADKIALQNEERRGELVDAGMAAERWNEVAGIVRRRLLAIPSNLSARLLGRSSVAEVKTIIEDEVFAALEQISAGATK
jgi:phage terminase Nu1 subunit (DNA packaging protein)